MGVSSGIAMDIHYCMGKVLQVDLYGKENSKYAKCKAYQKMGCCGEQYKFYKLTNAHQNIHNDHSFDAGCIAIANSHYSYNWRYTTGISYKTVTNNSPPKYTGPSVWILNCTFRI